MTDPTVLPPQDSRMKAYIAGPMSGIPALNFPAFFAAEKRLTKGGWSVVNPARIDQEQDYALVVDTPVLWLAEVYMRRDLPLLCTCDAIALLPGWQRSSGAQDELAVAQMCGLQVLDAETLQPMPPETVLQEAERLINGPRQAEYSHPLDDLTCTGRIWGAILGLPDVPAEKVAMCMDGVKLSRESRRHKRDNCVDGPGYWGLIPMIHEERGRRHG